MAFTENHGAKLYYDTQGAGTPLTLVMGLGGTSGWWFAQTPAFAERHNVILLDNRGTGRTQTSDPNYTMELMADDVIAVLDAAGIEKTHLCGISMGGMISQHVALRHPHRVDRLVLACTTPGGMNAVHPSPEVVEALTMQGDGEDLLQAFQAVAGILFPADYLNENMAPLMMMFAEQGLMPPTKLTLANQIGAVMGHDTYDRLGEIHHETLVVHGEADVLVPPGNADILAERIPNARLQLFADGGHGFNIQFRDEFNTAILDFLG